MTHFLADTGNEQDLLKALPRVRGRYSANAPLSNIVWFRVGGWAQVIFKPADIQDLSFFLREKPKDLPVHVLGVGSNVIIRDGGIPGVVIRLGKGFNGIALSNGLLDVGAGVLDRTIAMVSQEEAIKGLEFLSGIPGTVGGGLRMNAGCYGSEMKDILEVAFVLDPVGVLHKMTPEDLGFSYRHVALPRDWIFVGARLKAPQGDAKIISSTIQNLLKEREETQPIHTRTGGSTFANPENGGKAWALIDKAGCRGLRVGGAQMSELHCNFMVNTGNATAKDLETLGETVREKVQKTQGVSLRWEIQRMGVEKDVMIPMPKDSMCSSTNEKVA